MKSLRVFCAAVLSFMMFQEMYGMRIVKDVLKVLSKVRDIVGDIKLNVKEVRDLVGDIKLNRQLKTYHWNMVIEHKKILQRFPWYHDVLCKSCNEDAAIFFERQNMLRNAQENKKWLQGLYAPDSKLLFRYTSALDTIQGRNRNALFDGSLDPYMLAMIEGVMGNDKYTKKEKEAFIGPILTDESFQENKENNDGKDIYAFSKKVLELGIEVDRLSFEKAFSLAIKHNNIFTAEAIIKHLLSVMKERQEFWQKHLLARYVVETAMKKNEKMAAVFFDCRVENPTGQGDGNYPWLKEQEEKAIIRAAKCIEEKQLGGLIDNF